MRTSIIIRAYNEEKHIGRLLEEIRKQKASFEYELILVDSGSTDNTIAIALNFGVKVVSITPDKFSFGYSLNRGLEVSGGEFCVFISAHSYPADEFWLDNLISPFDDQTIALVFGKQRGDHTTRFSEHQIFARWFPDGGGGKQDSPFCNNANAAIRKSVWKQFQYNELLTGLEDIDWTKGAISRGYAVCYASDAVVIHLHNENALQIFRRYEREAIAMKAIYPEESFSLLDFIKLAVLNALSDYIHALHDGTFFKNILGIPAMRFPQFWGTYKGYNYKKPISNELRQKFYYPRSTLFFNSRKKTR